MTSVSLGKLFTRARKFLPYYKPYRALLAADLLCAALVSATALIIPLCARYITETVLALPASDALTQIALVGIGMVGLVIVQSAANTFVDYRGHMMGTLMESDMRRDLFHHLQKLSFSFYDDRKTGQLMSRLTHDLFGITELAHHGPEDLMIALLKFTGTFIILISINLPLTLTIFLFLPLMLVYALYFNHKMGIAMRQNADRMADVNAQVEDALAGIRVVKSFTNEQVERDKFEAANRRFVESRRADYHSEAFFYGGMGAFTQFFLIAVILLGAVSIVNQSLSLPDLLAFLLYAGTLTEPVQRVVNFSRLYQWGATGFNRFQEIMEIEPEIQDAPNAIDPGTLRGEIGFERVGFKYKEDLPHTLKGISLHISAGEYVALVGMSGAGKTTLCSLIPRFYDVSEGTITLDGIDIRQMRLEALRQNIGIVQQDVYLFNGTVAENIGYGRRDATREQIIEAAKRANAHDFIVSLPNGYDTDIGQRGVKLSGGQRQRLSIARVFLKDPPIIIFDEATSALDNESESAVRDAIDRLVSNRTMIVIAHRLSTIRSARRIIVLTEQGIEEMGTHDQLIARNGGYAALYQLQARLERNV